MDNQTTIYQHHVPQHYLKLWTTLDGCVWWHDLSLGIVKLKRTKRILGENFYYEENPEHPNNEIENYLSKIENEAAPLLHDISVLPPASCIDPAEKQEVMCTLAARLLSKDGAKINLFNFISAQLVRTPRTVEEISRAIESSYLTGDVRAVLESQNKPFELVKLGMERLPKRLNEAYTLVLTYSDKQPFVTSDHPVVEMCANPNLLPQTVYNVLHQTDTLLAFPISPRFQCLLLPSRQEHPLIRGMAETLNSWRNNEKIDNGIKWRFLQPELINYLRMIQTGFGRQILIGCQNESELVAESPLRQSPVIGGVDNK